MVESVERVNRAQRVSGFVGLMGQWVLDDDDKVF